MDGTMRANPEADIWAQAKRLHLSLDPLAPETAQALSQLIRHPWHSEALEPGDLVRAKVAVYTGDIAHVVALFPETGDVGLVGTVRDPKGTCTVKLVGGLRRPTWNCSCTTSRRAICRHLTSMVGWLQYHGVRAQLPKHLADWEVGMCKAYHARIGQKQASAELRFILNVECGDGDAMPLLRVVPEVVLSDGQVVPITAGREGGRDRQSAMEAAASRLAPKAAALLGHVRMMRPVQGRASSGYVFEANELARGALHEAFANYPVHWGSSTEPRLTYVAPRAPIVQWHADATGAQRVSLMVMPVGTRVFRAGGMVFADLEAGEIGFVVGNVVVLGHLAQMPSIGLRELDAVRASFELLVPAEICPPPRPLPAPEPLVVAPTGVITLDGVVDGVDGKSGREKWLFARLSYRYGRFQVEASPEEMAEPIRCDGKALFAVQRDADAESRLLAAFQALDWTPMTQAPDRLRQPYIGSLRAKPVASQVLSLELQKRVPAMEAAGFAVAFGEGFGIACVDGEDAVLRRRVAAGPKDTVSFAAEIEIGGVRYPLIRLIIDALKDRSGPLRPDREVGPDEMWSGFLNNELRVRLPLARLRALALPLVDWLRSEPQLADGRIALHRTRALGLLGDPNAARIEGVGMLESMAEQMRSFDHADLHAIPAALAKPLAPHQPEALVFLNRAAAQGFGAGYFDGMGAGKTVVAIAHHLWRRQYGYFPAPTLVIAPTTPLEAWRKDVPVFAPGERLLDLSAEGADAIAKAGQHDIVIASLDFVRENARAMAAVRWGLCLVDEAQSVKNPATLAHQAVASLKVAAFVPMTGTPIENSLDDFYHLMSLAVPGLLGSPATFARQYRDPIERHNCKKAIASLKRVAEPFYLRRDTPAIVPDLPPLTETIVRVPVPASHVDYYASVHARLSKEARDEGLVWSARAITLLTDALLVSCDPALRQQLPAPAVVGPPPKLAAAIERIRAARAAGEHVLVFSRFKLVLDALFPYLDAQGLRCGWITGESQDRGDVVRDFQSGVYDLCLISTLAGNAGVTLTRATRLIFLDHWWTGAVRRQAIARAWRLTQTSAVHVDHLLLADSVDERVWAIQKRKDNLFDAVFGEGDVERGLLTSKDMAELFDVEDITPAQVIAPATLLGELD